MKAFTATWMNLEMIILSEVSQTQKDKYHITYMWNLKKTPKDTNSTYLQNRNRPTDRKQTMVTKGERVRREGYIGVWDYLIRTTIYEIDKQQGPPV